MNVDLHKVRSKNQFLLFVIDYSKDYITYWLKKDPPLLQGPV